ncbi:dihydrolipoamide acetyltransferase family protein [Halostagnicola bangensis]
MVRKEFELPDVGEGVAEGELVTWLVEPGDQVQEDQPIAEVETDKALVEIPSSYDGVIAEQRAEEGEIIEVDEVFVVFDVDDSSLADDSSSSGGSADDTEGSAEAASAAGSDRSAERADETEAAAVTDAGAGSNSDSSVPDGRVFAPPSVRALARELGVELSAVQRQTGATDRRLAESDVYAVADGHAETEETIPQSGTDPTGTDPAEQESDSSTPVRVTGESASVPTERVEAAGRDRTLAMPATRQLALEEGVSLDDVPASERRDGEPFVTPEDVRAFSRGDGPAATPSSAPETPSRAGTDDERPGDRIPYSGVRKTIGEQMATSKYTAPHVSHHDEVDVSELVAARSRLKSEAKARETKLTYMPFAVKAVVAALKEVPAINAELDEETEEILLHDEYNIGIAVASDAGLMVPVIDDADQKSLLELAREINDKAERARDRSIGLEEMQGGTFTITNVGAIGGEYASPIINYPEAGILALGAMKERPWAEDGELVVRETMPISMSVDHRIVDGAEAAQFTNEVKRYLNNPELLLLD